MKSRVAVIVRTKNRPILLRRTLESIIRQSYEDWAIILVNNGGIIDELNVVLTEYEDRLFNKINVVHTHESYNMEVATNIAINNSESEFISILDDDDTWDSQFLEVCIKSLDSDIHVDGVVTHTLLVYEEMNNNQIIIKSQEILNRNLRRVSKWGIAMNNVFTTNSFVFRRNVLVDIGLYRGDLPVLGDWEFNIRFLRSKKIEIIPIPLSNYHKRVNVSNHSYSNSDLYKHYKYDKIIRSEYFSKALNEKDIVFAMIIKSWGLINQIKRSLRKWLK